MKSKRGFKALPLLTAVVLLASACSKESAGECRTVARRLSAAQVEQRNLIETQAEDAENLPANTLIYGNREGGKTIYMFSSPLSDAGENTEITENGSCLTLGNICDRFLPPVLSHQSAILINAPDTHACVYPEGETSHNAVMGERENIFGQKEMAATYVDVFGKGVDYICWPTTFGINTEIVLKKKPETNTFRLRVELPNLVADTGSPDYILFKTALENGVASAMLYTPLAADSGKKGTASWTYNNSVRLIDKDSESGAYTVEYTIDEAFLQDKKTKYPVRLNQSIHLYKSKQPDTSAYSETGDEAGHYLSPYMLLGDSTIKGEGWTYVRFETLKDLEIDPEKIVSATYTVRNLFTSSREVTIGAYAVTADWCSINTRWFNRPSQDEAPVAQTIIRERGDVSLDMTSLIKEILRNREYTDAKYSVQNSFVIRCDTPGGNLLFASGDNGLYSPVLEIVVAD